MDAILLLGNILTPIASILGLIMNGIYEFFHLFGIQNIALTIFVFTFITKMLMLPLTIKQQKFTRLSSIMNPEVQKVQAKYKGKKDEVSLRKQQEETKIIYQKYGASPTSGCLPLLITLPIMFALYQVINNIPEHVNLVNKMYNEVAQAITDKGLLSEMAALVTKIKIDVANLTDNSKIIGVLAAFTKSQWNALKEILPESSNALASIKDIVKVNNLFGLSITNQPSWKEISVIVPVLAAGLQFAQSKQMTVKNKGTNKENPGANAMGTMNVVMPIMSGFFCLILPIGVGLYWIASSMFAIIQQFFINRYLDKKGVDEIIEANLKKATGKKVGHPATGASLQELARKQTKNIESSLPEKANGMNKDQIAEESSETKTSEDTQKEPYRPTSISEIANLLKNRNNEKGDK